MRIDAHQHFWRVERAIDYPWMSADQAILYRDHGPEDLQPLLSRHGIDGTLLVQASPTLSETHALLRIAQQTPFVQGVVGWCEFEDAAAPETIAGLARAPMLRGLRPMVQDIADDDWLLRDNLQPAFAAMVQHGLVFDALVRPQHLLRLDVLAQRQPALQLVIDHGAKPAIESGQLGAWRRDIALVAKHANTVCKLSGLVTECGDDWSTDRLRPVVDHLLDCFGPARLLWGSDWPVVNLAGGYDAWVETSFSLLSALQDAERDAVWGGNASRVYLEGRRAKG
ncbi:MAG: amidohydrolase [Variovorax sp.]|nr:amidohydrolase [Variovorax sp.]